MKYFFQSLLLFFLVGACRPKSPELPIPRDQLVPVLVDVQLAEAILQNFYGQEKDSLAQLYYQKICSLHGVEKSKLDSTLVLLQQDPQRMQDVFSEVLDSLTVREAAIQ